MMKTIFALAGVLCFGAFAVEPHDHDHAAHDHDHAAHDHAAHDTTTRATARRRRA